VPTRRDEARKIHIRLTPELHQRLRVRCAERDTTIQDFVVELLERELGPEGARKPRARRPGRP
jgi:plasmid stability protein